MLDFSSLLQILCMFSYYLGLDYPPSPPKSGPKMGIWGQCIWEVTQGSCVKKRGSETGRGICQKWGCKWVGYLCKQLWYIPTEEHLRDCGMCLRIERQEIVIFICQLPSLFGWWLLPGVLISWHVQSSLSCRWVQNILLEPEKARTCLP